MERGRGRPVLMLHGNPSWGFLYRKVASALASEPLRLIVPDLIGLGFSDKPRDASLHRLDNHAAWIGELIDALQLEDVIFVGQDWGGPIGGCAFADRGERLAGLVILNTVLGPPKPGFRPTAFHRLARVPGLSQLAFVGLGLPQRGMRFAQGDRSSIRGQVARAYRHPLRRMRDRVAPLALARMVPSSLDHETIPALRRCQQTIEAFRGPSAIVWGDRDPVLGRVRRRIERLLPNARVSVTAAGHFLQEEVPREIADAIKDVAARAKAG
jgi:haloalkane dehalogenase